MAKARIMILAANTHARAVNQTKGLYPEQMQKHPFTHCPHCNKECMVGQTIVTKRNQQTTKWYHRECAIKLNIIWEDDE